MDFKQWLEGTIEKLDAGIISPQGEIMQMDKRSEHADWFAGKKSGPFAVSRKHKDIMNQKIREGWITWRYWGEDYGFTIRMNPSEKSKNNLIQFLEPLNMSGETLSIFYSNGERDSLRVQEFINQQGSKHLTVSAPQLSPQSPEWKKQPNIVKYPYADHFEIERGI